MSAETVNIYSFVTQAPGKQTPRFDDKERQWSKPFFLGGSKVNINTFESLDCTTSMVKQFKGLNVPDPDVEKLLFNLS